MRACRLPGLGGQATHSDFGWKAADERLLAVVALDPRLLLVELDRLVAEERYELDDPLQQLAGGAPRWAEHNNLGLLGQEEAGAENCDAEGLPEASRRADQHLARARFPAVLLHDAGLLHAPVFAVHDARRRLEEVFVELELMGRSLKPAFVHLLEQRLQRAEVGVALEFVARQPLAQQVVLAHAGLDPPRIHEVGQAHGLATLARPLDHAPMMPLKLGEQRDHPTLGWRRRRAAPRALTRGRASERSRVKAARAPCSGRGCWSASSCPASASRPSSSSAACGPRCARARGRASATRRWGGGASEHSSSEIIKKLMLANGVR